MPISGNLWAVGYDDTERANQVREEIISLGWDKHYPLRHWCTENLSFTEAITGAMA